MHSMGKAEAERHAWAAVVEAARQHDRERTVTSWLRKQEAHRRWSAVFLRRERAAA